MIRGAGPRQRRSFPERQRGQAFLELVLVLFAFFTVAFLYVQMALNFSVANYIQYATFMSARALLSGASDESEQKTAATNVLRYSLQKENGEDRFEHIIRPEGGNSDLPGGYLYGSANVPLAPHSEARNAAWEQGVAYAFSTRMYMLPMMPGAKRGEENRVKLRSESWLGRDPTFAECVRYLETRQANMGGKAPYLYDNGC